MLKTIIIGCVTAVILSGCGGGGSDGGGVDEGGGSGNKATPLSAYPSRQGWFSPEREADGTIVYCDDFALPEWPPLRFENNTWGNDPIAGYEPITDYDQCILVRETEAGLEHGWRWDWPFDRGHVKGYPEVHYGQKNYFSEPSSAPDVPIRISDIEEMTVRWDVDMAAEGIFNLAFDILLHPTGLPARPTWTGKIPRELEPSHEIMVWVDASGGFIPQPEMYFVEEVIIDGISYDFYRRDNFDPYTFTRLPGDIAEDTRSIQQFNGPEGRFSGTLDLAKFFDWLVDEGHVDPSYWVTVIEFGNEVIEGTGEVWLREYEVTVRTD